MSFTSTSLLATIIAAAYDSLKKSHRIFLLTMLAKEISSLIKESAEPEDLASFMGDPTMSTYGFDCLDALTAIQYYSPYDLLSRLTVDFTRMVQKYETLRYPKGGRTKFITKFAAKRRTGSAPPPPPPPHQLPIPPVAPPPRPPPPLAPPERTHDVVYLKSLRITVELHGSLGLRVSHFIPSPQLVAFLFKEGVYCSGNNEQPGTTTETLPLRMVVVNGFENNHTIGGYAGIQEGDWLLLRNDDDDNNNNNQVAGPTYIVDYDEILSVIWGGKRPITFLVFRKTTAPPPPERTTPRMPPPP